MIVILLEFVRSLSRVFFFNDNRIFNDIFKTITASRMNIETEDFGFC